MAVTGKFDNSGKSIAQTPVGQPSEELPAGSASGEDVDSTGLMESEQNVQQRLERTERLLEEHQEAVFRYAYRLCGCSSTAEDIAQEVFLRAFRSLHQLRDEAAARGWLLVIARNEFLRWCRKSADMGHAIDPHDCDLPSESELPLLERQEWVEAALQQLPDEFRLVLLMFYFEELSYAEIAEQLKIPVGTVMSRLSRGRGHMKTALEKANSRTV